MVRFLNSLKHVIEFKAKLKVDQLLVILYINFNKLVGIVVFFCETFDRKLMDYHFFGLQGFQNEGKLPEKSSSYEGVFYNYFSIGTILFLFALHL